MRLNLIASILARFFRPSTDKALAGITKSLRQLEQVVEAETIEANRQTEIAARAQIAKGEALSRSKRAARVAEKINDLVS